ncbi:MAG: BON domain-containing protein [Mariprofundaceae bacterium]
MNNWRSALLLILRLCLFALLLSLTACFATAVLGGGAATGSASFDERSLGQHGDDVALATKIDGRLVAEKDMPSRWVSVEVIDGVVTLTGYLPSQSHIDRAIYICRSFEGVRAVHSKLKIGSPKVSSLFSDTWITTRVKTRLIDDPVVSGFGIHVETVDGKVYLQGIVSRQSHRDRAKRLARSVDGVTAVVDLMRIKQQ